MKLNLWLFTFALVFVVASISNAEPNTDRERLLERLRQIEGRQEAQPESQAQGAAVPTPVRQPDHGEVDLVAEIRNILEEKYHSIEAIRAIFGSQANWEETAEHDTGHPNPQITSFELDYIMVSPGAEIRGLSRWYVYADGRVEFQHIILDFSIENSGIQDFLGIDVGSSREDVIRRFGDPQIIREAEIEGNRIVYSDHFWGSHTVSFIIENDRVIKMIYHDLNW